jgi:protein-tyrosine-phosphatase
LTQYILNDYLGLVSIEQRARVFAALGDPARLAIIEGLRVSDATPRDLGRRHNLASNLLSHHLSVLENAGLIARSVSAGDARRRYVRLRHETLDTIHLRQAGPDGPVPAGPVLFVCTRNSARSQLAAALWSSLGNNPATSAGTEPAESIHPGAVAAAGRAGLDLTAATTQHIDAVRVDPALTITVCDQAHEQIDNPASHWHWSIPDPVVRPTTQSFDVALERLRKRILTITGANP